MSIAINRCLFLLFLIYTVQVFSEDGNGKDHHPSQRNFNQPKEVNKDELDNSFWNMEAQQTIASKLKTKPITNKAKNLIIFLGDGMSMQTIVAARSFYKDERFKLPFEEFPYFGLSKTYCVDSQVSESACTATAYLTGIKNNFATLGVNSNVKFEDCHKGSNVTTYTESIATWAKKAGKMTGLVTTSRVTHASPAGVYAHTASRFWETDSDIIRKGCDPNINLDIAQQLIHGYEGKNLNVILGGGRSNFLGKNAFDEQGNPGKRTDNRNLINEWISSRRILGNSIYVWNRDSLMSINTNKTDYILGLFDGSHCPYHGDIKRKNLQNIQPTLTEMTEIAIKTLQNEPNGFFLFVEGAKIDMAHHEGKAAKALEDTIEFSNAVQKAVNMTSKEDTLIVVTSDHSHTMTINGYPNRGDDILGLSGNKGSDKLPYTILSYANGPGFYNTYKKNGGGRRDLSHDDFKDPNYKYPATVPLKYETHGGEDVPIYTSGPNANMFIGNFEQNAIPYLMAYAAKIGPYS